MAKVAKFDINEPIAKPSKPSVRLTALLQPTITKIAHGMNNRPKSGCKYLKNGKYKEVEILENNKHKAIKKAQNT